MPTQRMVEGQFDLCKSLAGQEERPPSCPRIAGTAIQSVTGSLASYPDSDGLKFGGKPCVLDPCSGAGSTMFTIYKRRQILKS